MTAEEAKEYGMIDSVFGTKIIYIYNKVCQRKYVASVDVVNLR